ncbi:MAG: flagellar biosynthesis anti-sigma factor FlgM [Treponema sp.]|jgi:negative regulator of flagellin synthesis FlgM|nr:flagellar biosynthesis anti-sigma factor FlgM [Treponema sp.]
MTIDRIGYSEPIQPGKKPGRGEPVNKEAKSDSITLSSEAMEKSELYQAIKIVSVASDIRLERIEELKQKINDPLYLNETTINATADKIMDFFGL